MHIGMLMISRGYEILYVCSSCRKCSVFTSKATENKKFSLKKKNSMEFIILTKLSNKIYRKILKITSRHVEFKQ
jgi:hypothetical protein